MCLPPPPQKKKKPMLLLLFFFFFFFFFLGGGFLFCLSKDIVGILGACMYPYAGIGIEDTKIWAREKSEFPNYFEELIQGVRSVFIGSPCIGQFYTCSSPTDESMAAP